MASSRLTPAGHIVAKVLRRIRHRLSDERVRSKVHDCLRPYLFECILYIAAIPQISDNQFRTGVDSPSMSFSQIVEDGDGMPGIDDLLDANAADVPGAAGQEDVHGICEM
jgi:hypothetical protein